MTYVPRLHMRLSVLLRRWVVELQGAQTRSAHQEECNELNLLNVALRCVLRSDVSTLRRKLLHGIAHVEDCEDLLVARDCVKLVQIHEDRQEK